MNAHGTMPMYRDGCRCEPCRAVKKRVRGEENARRAERAAAGIPAKVGRPTVPMSQRPHGSYVTYTRGCRCAPCTAANTEYGRERKALRELAHWEHTGELREA